MRAPPSAASIGRRGFAAGMACLALPRLAKASSLDGRGISDDDVLAGFDALSQARMAFQDGQSFALRNFRGRALLVNFWAHWCANCVAEFASMRQLQQAAGGPARFAVVLVSQPKDWSQDQAMARDRAIPFPLAVYANDGSPADEAATASILFGNLVGRTARYGLPVCYMVSRSGHVVLAGSGAMDWLGSHAMAKAAQALHA